MATAATTGETGGGQTTTRTIKEKPMAQDHVSYVDHIPVI
jgi:hypothetical protein